MTQIFAPFTPEQVEALNRYQREAYFHPFTCGGDRADEAHQKYAEEHGDRDLGLLVATPDGWRCPVCSYTQNWAHDFMADGRALAVPVFPGFPEFKPSSAKTEPDSNDD